MDHYKSGAFEWTPGAPWPPKVRDDITGDGLDYETDYYEDYMADVDEQRAHHFTNAHSPYNDGWTQQISSRTIRKNGKNRP